MILIIKHSVIEGPGTLGSFLQGRGYDIRIVELQKGEALPAPGECRAIICLGGPMNVYETDKYPFLAQEEIFIKQAIEQSIPFFGICLGAQILAKVCGAQVRKADYKEVGWYRARLTEEGKKDVLFQDVPHQLDVFQWHEDTFDLPSGACLLVAAEGCVNQAFRYGRNAYGLQFHIEVNEEMIESWCADNGNSRYATKMIRDYYRLKENFQQQASLCYKNLADIIEKKKHNNQK